MWTERCLPAFDATENEISAQRHVACAGHQAERSNREAERTTQEDLTHLFLLFFDLRAPLSKRWPTAPSTAPTARPTAAPVNRDLRSVISLPFQNICQVEQVFHGMCTGSYQIHATYLHEEAWLVPVAEIDDSRSSWAIWLQYLALLHAGDDKSDSRRRQTSDG